MSNKLNEQAKELRQRRAFILGRYDAVGVRPLTVETMTAALHGKAFLRLWTENGASSGAREATLTLANMTRRPWFYTELDASMFQRDKFAWDAATTLANMDRQIALLTKSKAEAPKPAPRINAEAALVAMNVAVEASLPRTAYDLIVETRGEGADIADVVKLNDMQFNKPVSKNPKPSKGKPLSKTGVKNTADRIELAAAKRKAKH